MNPNAIASRAANIKDGKNPSFAIDDFRKMMPAFTSEIVADDIVQQYVDMAHAVVKKSRWHQLWKEGMRLYIAHFLMLYIQTTADPSSGIPGIINAGATRGIATSKSVEAISVNYDVNLANGDLTGWADWKLTNYGSQFATLARMLGKGGMYVR